LSRIAPIAITSGEPAGVGPELCARLAPAADAGLVLLCDRGLFESRARAIGLSPSLPEYRPGDDHPPISLLHVPVAAPVRAGELEPANAAYVLAMLERAADGAARGEFSGMVTAPVHKAVINAAGVPFTGHTEFLADRLGVAQVVMMLVGGGMRVALATTHLPLRDVADAITVDGLAETLRILHADLVRRFGIPAPRILVAGLNPHAGESGCLGREEIDVIEPVLDALRREGMQLVGPLPADTLFQPKYLDAADAVLAMYHDQGLPVLKHASFGTGVNVTLGLPVIRTSVDHGTALDLAGTGLADAGSLYAAVTLAAQLAARTASSIHPPVTGEHP
jgi:4-hydroxythreonine-4-phosphate dehydrogenase